MNIFEVQAKSIFVRSRLPDADYVANPYTGCQFGCLYCYATFTGRFVHQPREEWGKYVYVKTNAAELARAQLAKWPESRKGATIFLSSVTDPYQGIEKKYRLSRGILEALRDAAYYGKISILTKSPLILRDIELLRDLKADVGLTITTTDDRVSRFLEVTAPLVSRRLDTLRELNAQGVRTYAFIGPVLPHFRCQPELLDDLFRSIAETGTQDIYVEHIHLPTYVRGRLQPVLHGQPESVQALYRGAASPAHRAELEGMIDALVSKYHLRLRLGQAIYHEEWIKNSTSPADAR